MSRALFEVGPGWSWARMSCPECGLRITEEFDALQSHLFTRRTLFGRGPVCEEALAGQDAVRRRLEETFREKGCPHVER